MTFPHDASQYQMVALIGKGASSEVYQAHCLTNDRDVAIKLIDLDDYSVDMEFLRQEVAFWSSSQHANIVEYYGSFLEGKHLYILMEFLSGGSVYDIMRFAFKDGFQDEMVIATILKSITEALAYIHQNGQIHRDIKPGNAIIGEDGSVKIGDFGLARNLGDDFARTRVGTPYYMSPELVSGRGYDEKSDIWALGCVIYEMARLRPPFTSACRSEDELFMRIKSGNVGRIPSMYSDSLWECICSMLDKDPKKRPSAGEILKIHNVQLAMRLSKARQQLSSIRQKRQALAQKMELLKAREMKVIQLERNQRPTESGRINFANM